MLKGVEGSGKKKVLIKNSVMTAAAGKREEEGGLALTSSFPRL